MTYTSTLGCVRGGLGFAFAVFVAGSPVFLHPRVAPAKQVAYVTDISGNQVHVIDVGANTISATIPVAATPFGVAATPDGTEVYVGSTASRVVTVVRTATNTIDATIPTSSQPGPILITSDGARAYAGPHGPGVSSAGMAVIDVRERTVVHDIVVGYGDQNIEDLVADPTSTVAYYSLCSWANPYYNIVGFDTATDTLLGDTYAPWGLCFHLALSPDGHWAYISATNGFVYVGEAAKLYLWPREGDFVASIPLGGNPQDIVVTPDGAFAYVAVSGLNVVNVIDTATYGVTATIPVGASPTKVAITPDGDFVYVTNQSSGSVSVIDTATNGVVATVPGVGQPYAIAIAWVRHCGDGAVDPGEECDDGNLVDGDGCDSNCKTTGCGNGIVTSGEVCDDGNLVDGDGCDSNCTLTACGNGVRAGSEQCDDGNLIDGDGCQANCTLTPQHDSAVAPLPPKTYTIPASEAFVTKKVDVKVTNADVSPPDTHRIQLIPANVDCPADTLVGLPDFDSKTPGDQDAIDVRAGGSKTAAVALRFDSTSYTGFNRKAPHRCTLRFTATTVLTGGAVDPRPSNDTAILELSIIDKNDPELTTTHESVLKSTKPVKATIGHGKITLTKNVPVKVVNADIGEAAPGHTITLTVTDSDCPVGTVGTPDFDTSTPAPDTSVTVAGAATKTAMLPLTIDGSAFFSPNGKSPMRCTVELTATGPGVDPEDTNNRTKLVIDVIDKNDF